MIAAWAGGFIGYLAEPRAFSRAPHDVTYAGLVTIMLMAVTVILTVLIIALTAGAIFGYTTFRDLIKDQSTRAAEAAVERERARSTATAAFPAPTGDEGERGTIAEEADDH